MKLNLQKTIGSESGVQVVFRDVPALQVSAAELVVPLKDPEKLTRRQWDRLIRKVIRQAQSHRLEKLVITVSDLPSWEHLSWTREHMLNRLVTNLLLASYNFRRYKQEPKEGWGDVAEVGLVDEWNETDEKIVEQAQIIADYTKAVRDLSNTRGADMTPVILAEEVAKLTKDLDVTVTIFDEDNIKSEKMWALEAVGRGSDEESRFIIIEYWGAGRDAGQPDVMVGKGITFDTGGLYVKPSGYMNEMNMDMSGGANVIGAICAVAKLGIKKNVVALIPAAENAVSGKSYRPGDIINSLSGKTIEVLHTDAEGRLVMADALAYAANYKPARVIDVATLTGAALVALGERTSALFANDDDLADELLQAGKVSGDEVWRMPLWPEYDADIKGSHSDLTNIHNKNSRYGGCIEAATFLHQFAADYTWAHIDMAPRMASNGEDNLDVGATGEPMRLLVQWLRQ